MRATRPGSSTSSTPASSPQSDSPPSPPQKLEADFKTIMSIGAERAGYQDSLNAEKDQQRLIVIDAPNVAMRHGKGKIFSCAGIELAVSYFQALGHRPHAAKIPDDVALLERLMLKGVLIPTPPQDYDDSYSIQYAGLHNGYVVTNDLFRDHIVNMVGPRERKVAMRAWLRAHQISYSWVRNEFLPNPSFRFPETADGAF
ncbi:Ribonuclease Zc3h12a-like, NYN domain [Phytophthora cactorum]|nr:Ribonuclease Zc3h12a-like, NYN domain [Phytophthora cactorum]